MPRDPKLTVPTRDVLIEHVDGPVSINARITNNLMTQNRDRHLRAMAVTHCIQRNWLKLDRPVSPTQTIITNAGREVLAAALADWADALMRAGRGDGDFLRAHGINLKEEIDVPVPGIPALPSANRDGADEG